MTGTFKANNPYNTFLLLVYAILLKLPMFLHAKVPQPQLTDGFLYKALLKWMQPFGSAFPVIYAFAAFLLLYVQAVSFNKIVNELRLMQKPNYLTGMSYLLLTSLFTEWNIFSATLIISTLLVWIWARISQLNNNDSPKTTLFNIGIVIGIGTFFYFPSITFVILVMAGLAITRAFRLAEWVIVLLGITTPYYFILSMVFLADKLKNYHFPGIAVMLPKFTQTNWSYAAIALVILTAVIGFIFVQQNFMRQLIQARKSWSLIYLYLLVAVFVPFINATQSFQYWVLTAIPLSALLGAAFFYPQKKLIPQILHWAMAALAITIGYVISI